MRQDAATQGHVTSALGATVSRWSLAADLIDPPGLKWRRDPSRWALERAKIELWSKQREIIESVRDHRQTAVHSCHEIGKSYIAAVTACWWIDSHPPGEAFVVTTAPSDKQVKAILWREINRLHSRLGLAGRTNLSEWYIGKELVAFGRKPADYDPTAFQGLHARYMLVILDEACGIPKELWDAASSLAANLNGRTLAIGNPDDPFGEFCANCRPGSGWDVIKVGYEDTPNFTDEVITPELSEMLIHPEWVEERRRKWGEQSALFQSKCRGIFPTEASPFAVMPLNWVQACQFNEMRAQDPIEGGLDVAAGGDRTVLVERRGPKLGRVFEFKDPDPMKSVGIIVEKINEWGLTKVKYDNIGIGWGLGGRLKELSSRHNPDGDKTHNAEIVGINFGAGPTPGMEDRFLNKRAEVWWNVGHEYSRLGLWDLSALDDDAKQELTTPLYEILDSKGKIKIQAKKEIREILGRSPDVADALLLAFYDTLSEAVLQTTGVRETVLTDAFGWSRTRMRT